MYTDTLADKIFDTIVAIILIVSLFFLGIFIYDDITEQTRFDNGIIVDKYRGKYDTANITVEKDGEFVSFEIPISDYLSYDIGDIYNAPE